MMKENGKSGQSSTGEKSPYSADSVKVSAVIADNKQSIELRFTRDANTLWVVTADVALMDSLVSVLAETRCQMLEQIPLSLPDGVHPLAAYDPRWYVLPDTDNRFATFWIRHPGLGWSGYGFPRHEAGSISKFLRKVIGITSTQDTLPRSASSFGGDKFLITSAGLGFYWYGKGERRIGPNPFEQVEYDSDRAAGIVAGSIVEQRLEEALKSRLRTDKSAIAQNLFRPSGALGPFSTKIDLAYLSGLLTDEAFKDLSSIKNIRNDFAHELELDSFDAQSIKDRCKNLLLVDRHVGPVPSPSPGEVMLDGPSPYMGLPDYEQKLADPRFRYMMTAQLISYGLGEGSENPTGSLPLV